MLFNKYLQNIGYYYTRSWGSVQSSTMIEIAEHRKLEQIYK